MDLSLKVPNLDAIRITGKGCFMERFGFIHIFGMLASLLFACSEQANFDTSSAARDFNEHSNEPQSEDLDQQTSSEEDEEEEIVATPPTIISGSYLSCNISDAEHACTARYIFPANQNHSQKLTISVTQMGGEQEKVELLTVDISNNETFKFFPAFDPSSNYLEVRVLRGGFVDVYDYSKGIRANESDSFDIKPSKTLKQTSEGLIEEIKSPVEEDIEIEIEEATEEQVVETETETETETELQSQVYSLNTAVHLGNNNWRSGTNAECSRLEQNRDDLFGPNYALEVNIPEGSSIQRVKINAMCGVDYVNNELRIYDNTGSMLMRFTLTPGSNSFDSGAFELNAGTYQIVVFSSDFDPPTGYFGEDDFLIEQIEVLYKGGIEFSEAFVR